MSDEDLSGLLEDAWADADRIIKRVVFRRLDFNAGERLDLDLFNTVFAEVNYRVMHNAR